ncbi:MAG: sensor histidine kinase [Chitinophagales bacterium]
MAKHGMRYAYIVTAIVFLVGALPLSANCAPSAYPVQSAVLIESPRDTVIDLANRTVVYDDTFAAHTSFRSIPLSWYKPLKGFRSSGKHSKITHTTQWLRVVVSNKTADTAQCYVYCGKHNFIALYDERDSIIQQGGFADYSGNAVRFFPDYYLPVYLAPGETKTINISLTNYGVLPGSIESQLYIGRENPRIQKLQQPLYLTWLLLSCLICGGILMLGLFTFAQFFTTRKAEYFFYGLYALIMFLNIERAGEWAFNLRIISQYIPNYFFISATLLNVCAGTCYLLFTRYFLDLKNQSKRINRMISFFLVFLISGALVIGYGVVSATDGYWILTVFKIFSLAPTICMLLLALSIYSAFGFNTAILKYYYAGFFFLFIGVGINIYVNNFARYLISGKFPFVFTVEAGALLEMICFAAGLGYKARLQEKLKTEAELLNLKLMHQNEINLLQVRSRLSRDLHDDIGSTLSSINILSSTAQNNLKHNSLEKVGEAIKKINERSQRLLNNMSDIIWNIQPGNDTMEEVISRMREFATTSFEAKNIAYKMNFPQRNIQHKLSAEVKNNLYLIFKEAVNNLTKYANCTQADVLFTLNEKEICLCINDNGVGFNQQEVKRKGGLRNMVQRAEEINATITIHSAEGKGTSLKLLLPIQ